MAKLRVVPPPKVPGKFNTDDRVVLESSLQQYRVVSARWIEAQGDYLVHAQFGVLHFYQWASKVRHA